MMGGVVPGRESSTWNIIGVGALRGAGMLALLLVAREAGAAQIGLAALANTLVGALAVLGDLGVGAVLVLSKNPTRNQLSAGITICLAVATLMATLVASLAGWVSEFFGQNSLAPLLVAIAVGLPLQGLTWFLDPLLQLRRDLAWRAAARLAQAFTQILGTLWLLQISSGAAALIVGQVAGIAVYALLAWIRYGRLPTPWTTKSSLISMVRESRPFLFQGGLAFVAQNADNIFIGKNLGPQQLGFYSTTYRISELPYGLLSEPVGQATFVRVSSTDDLQLRKEAYSRALGRLTSLAFPMAFGVGVWCPVALPYFLGDEWEGKYLLFATFGAWSLVRCVQGFQGYVANGVGAASYSARLTALILVIKLPLLWFASLHGIEAVAAVMLGAAVAQLLAIGRWLHRLQLGMSVIVRAAARPLAVNVVIAVLVAAAHHLLGTGILMVAFTGAAMAIPAMAAANSFRKDMQR